MVRTRTINNNSTPTDRSTSIAKKSNIRDFLPFTRSGTSPTPTAQVDTAPLDHSKAQGTGYSSEMTTREARLNVEEEANAIS